MQQPHRTPAENRIGEREKNAKKGHRNHDHDGGRPNLLPRRPIHLSHLHANLVKELPPSPRIFRKLSKRRSYRSAASIASNSFLFHFQHFCHGTLLIFTCSLKIPSSPPASSPPCKTGRGGGIRTPTSGFGDRRSTVEPTPLNFSSRRLEKFTPSPPFRAKGESRDTLRSSSVSSVSANSSIRLRRTHLTSLCPVCFRHVLQNLLVSSRSGCFFRFFVVV
jgi:hypothetical protein